MLKILVQNGQSVKAGQPLMYLDSRDVQKSLRDAQISLESAKLSMAKFIQPADGLSVLQSENSLIAAKESKDKTIDNLNQTYGDAYNSISNAFLNIPAIMTNLYDNIYSYKIGESERSVGSKQTNKDALLNTVSVISDVDKLNILKTNAENDYNSARVKYDTNFNNYKALTRFSEQSEISNLLNETIEDVKIISQAQKSEVNLYDAWIDSRTKQNQTIFSQVLSIKSQLSSDISQLNSIMSSLSSLQQSIKNYQSSIADSERTIEEKTQSLANLKAGPQTLDIQSQQLSLKQKEIALADTQEKLADYTVRAPFDGVVAKINVQKGDSLSSGSAAITMITNQQTVEISLNEVDVSKIKVGQKVNLTFDAIPDLNITGLVADVDSIGTVAQGVVTYNIKISLDTQDERVKSGMSVAASIITNIKQDVLRVPISAVKSNGGGQYLEMPTEDVAETSLDLNTGIILKNPTKQQIVETGLSNDTEIEIVSGLNEGDKIIIRTITSAATKTTTQATSLLQQVGGRAASGGTGGARNFGGAAGR
ncbi:MAG: efflux transporter, RND family, MFP subunit [uncultured bacterium]|nr:MAG: efflux transporter, RND family, MFP subunit [uncultured bacterium]